ncbi:MAG TPA: hypothetical protein VHO70_02760 [Chitinispirillaceae bacterium]|nr:hypothetical protein [Chitinispirillaceae bacterium]
MNIKKNYKVLQNLAYDKNEYHPNDTVEMEPEKAASLVELGVLGEDSDTDGDSEDEDSEIIIARQNETIAILNSELDKMRVTNRELEDAFAIARSNGNELGKVIENLQNRIDSLEAEHLAAKDKINSLEQDLKNAETHIDAIEPQSTAAEKPEAKQPKSKKS